MTKARGDFMKREISMTLQKREFESDLAGGQGHLKHRGLQGPQPEATYGWVTGQIPSFPGNWFSHL